MKKFFSFLLCCCSAYANAYTTFATDTIIDGKTIQDVVVTGREITVKDDKLIINLNEKIKKHSHDGYSALSLLSIPGLDVDPIDESVTTNGEATMLCINGREVGKDEVKTINPKDIKRIDYYQQFDPNHPNAKSVIDFIVRIRDYGGMLMAQANQNLNKVSGDDMVDWKMLNKKSQFNVQISGKYNHFTPSRGSETYTFMPFTGGDIEKDVVTKPSGTHGNGVSAKLAYLYSGKTSKFQMAVLLRNNHNADGTMQEQTLTGTGIIDTKDFRHSDNLSPVIKAYYKKKFNKKTSLEAQINTSYNHTKQWRDYEGLKTYTSHAKEDYYYLYPEITFTHKLSGRVNLFLMGMYFLQHSENTYIENGASTLNKLTEGQAIIMPGCNIQAIPKKLRFTVQLQERIQTLDMGTGAAYTKCYITPSLYTTIKLSKSTSLNTDVYSGVNSPDMKYYNNVEKRIDEYQVLSSNGNQKMGRLFGGQLSLNSYHKWGGFQIYSQYDHNQKELYEDIYCDDGRNLYVHTYLNGGTYERLGIYGELTVNLIPNKLKWRGSCQYTHTKQRIGYLNTLNAWNANTSLTYIDNGWQCKLDYRTRRKSLNMAGGTAISQQQLTINVGYTFNNWFFNLYAKNPFMKTSSRTELSKNGYIHTSHSYRPRTDYSMFAVRVSYRLTYGKKHKYQEIEIDDTNRSAIL